VAGRSEVPVDADVIVEEFQGNDAKVDASDRLPALGAGDQLAEG